ncbi:hypothetical protein NX059_002856 [Plenodomus lindquistii]|nr:hypothetical protein NX059_002856 [Plenodomus lindquistii]
MSGVMVVWANLPERSVDWYADEYLPVQAAIHSKHLLHCELTDSGFGPDPIGHLDAPWELMTVYEVADIKKMTESTYDKQYHPPELMEGARFDVRTYRELYRWGGEQWDGDIDRIVSVCAMEWRVSEEEEADVLKYYSEELAPLICESEDVLRYRLFKVYNGSVLEGDQVVTQDKDALPSYFTMVEFESDEWPWDKILELSETPNWRKYFEPREIVKWQTSQYLVQKRYTNSPKSPREKEGDSKAEN